MNSLLEPFWIKDRASSNLGFGVTAFSKEDAFNLLKEADVDLDIHSPDLVIKERINIQELDQNHVVPNMGPINLRGVWFPFLNLKNQKSRTRRCS